MSRPVRPTPPTTPTPPQSAAQKLAAQRNVKAPPAPPVYRPQPVPRVLQRKSAAVMPVNTPPHAQSAAPKTFGVKPPHTAQPTQTHAARPNQRTPVNPFKQPLKQPQPPSRVLQGRPAEAPRTGNTPPRQAPPVHARDTRTQPRVLQPKMASARQAPHGASVSPARPTATPLVIQRTINPSVVPNAVGVVQLNKKKAKPRSYAAITKGTLTTPIKNANKISARRDTDGRISNVRSRVRAGNKKGRKSTTGHKTTDTSGPINTFLRNANLLSKIVRMEGGHCIADVYGGSQCISNTVPLPHTFNTIAYKKEETALKKTLPTATDTTMEVSVEYPDNPLDGFLTKTEQNKLKRLVSATQYQKLEELFSNVPDFMAWEVNTAGGHDWIEFRDIRKDIWPRATKPKNVLTQNFINAVNNLA